MFSHRVLILTLSLLSIVASISAQQTLEVGKKPRQMTVKLGEEQVFRAKLKLGGRYSIVVDQKGIDVVVRLSGPDGTLIKEQDGTNGNNGPEIIYTEVAKEGEFVISVKPLVKRLNPPEGIYTIEVKRAPQNLTVYSLAELREDFDLLVQALREAHTGLNWYSSYKEFDDFCIRQRLLLRERMTALDLFRVIAPIVAFTREGHTAIRLSAEDTNYLNAFSRYLPFHVKFLNQKAYVINDVGEIKSRGMLLTKINGSPITDIVQAMLKIEPDDGFIDTGKYRWIEQNGNFPRYYLRLFADSDYFSVELTDPRTGATQSYQKIEGVTSSVLQKMWRDAAPKREYDYPAASIDFFDETHCAVLRYNGFDTLFKGEKFDFRKFTEEAFAKIKEREIKNLIIDVRMNDGGEEGLEDQVFAYLTDKPYTKYRYVQSSGPTYSFLDYTNFNTKERQERLKQTILNEHYLASDGRLLRRPGILPRAEPRADAFKGHLYVLTSGLTYSGGSEFASIVKGNRPDSTFIGEETGGGYYGNTSGIYLRLTLPHSKIWVRIPLLKFVVEVGGGIPFGRGVIPDWPIQPNIDDYLNGIDTEMRFAFNLISQREKRDPAP